ncbi:MAG: ORF6N domain-containing protein [Prevotella sp.]|nr:ORF6N domain-containing protein [Prevotella sp.]
MYGVETRTLNQAVKRNQKRFEGDDFMFRLSKDETQSVFSRSQIVTLNKGRGSNIKYLPYAFTELSVAMLSSVLKSETAINDQRPVGRKKFGGGFGIVNIKIYPMIENICYLCSLRIINHHSHNDNDNKAKV